MTLTCIVCDKELIGKQVKYCCANHRSIANHKAHGYSYHQRMRSKSPKTFIRQLLSYHNRKKTLSFEYVEELYNAQNGLCAITKIPMTYESGKGKLQTNISIDRIDSNVGYELGNVQLVCTIVNKMKSDMTDEQFKYWVKLLYDNL